ncbi:hypothetical protein QPK87_25230 [Kamptonema cortianum]|nr:hypothetical protein [Desertifilum sp.]MDK3159838.1 hypothetical protein [Kamptonema cortianum]
MVRHQYWAIAESAIWGVGLGVSLLSGLGGLLGGMAGAAFLVVNPACLLFSALVGIVAFYGSLAPQPQLNRRHLYAV